MSRMGRTPTHLEHLDMHRRAADGFGPCLDLADVWGRRLARLLASGRRLLAAGNGGSAAQAQHLTAELVGRYCHERPAFSAICLSAETSSLTAIINDYPAEELFSRQVQAHGRAGDVLVLLSTSGRSPNIVEAARRASGVGVATWAMTGGSPNPLANTADEALCVDAPMSSTVQELHLVALHVMCAGLDDELRRMPVDGATRSPDRVSAPSAT